MRRYLFIGATVIVALGAGIAAYFYYYGGRAEVTIAPPTTTNAGLPAASTQTTIPTDTGRSSSLSAGTSLPSAAAAKIGARLVEITKGPVAPGEAVIDVRAAETVASSPSASFGTTTPDIAAHFVDRQSGNLYSYLVRAGTLTRTSNRTIPGVARALWLPDASRVYLQYLSGDGFSTVNTYSIASDGSAGFFLAQDLADLAASVNGILALASSATGSSASLLRTDGTHPQSAFSTPLSMVRASEAGNSYLVFTKPAAALSGTAFLVDSAGRFSPIAGPLHGLVALISPSGKWVLVSFVAGSAMRMELVRAKDGSALPLPVASIADKCVWAADDSAAYCGVPVSPSAEYAYPDDWYQGVAHFSDRIWKIDAEGRYASLVLDFQKETGLPLDATALAIDPGTQTLVFVNKNDGALWAYRL